ncbi:MAG: hypothetical protein H6Q78_359, partial [Candidatus Krumholzibacteriota bacterium]|nr:hypothetical protein [Candidatus Krumholzibacteriota bacterium]
MDADEDIGALSFGDLGTVHEIEKHVRVAGQNRLEPLGLVQLPGDAAGDVERESLLDETTLRRPVVLPPVARIDGDHEHAVLPGSAPFVRRRRFRRRIAGCIRGSASVRGSARGRGVRGGSIGGDTLRAFAAVGERFGHVDHHPARHPVDRLEVVLAPPGGASQIEHDLRPPRQTVHPHAADDPVADLGREDVGRRAHVAQIDGDSIGVRVRPDLVARLGGKIEHDPGP